MASLVAMTCFLLPAGAAIAHDQLISTSPTNGASLAKAPGSVSMTFSADLIAIGSEILVTDDAGGRWQSGAPVVKGTVVTQPLRGGAGGGTYTVRWRVVSADGHPISGTFTFTLTGPRTAATTPATSAAPTLPSATPITTATTGATPIHPIPPPADTGKGLPWLSVGLVILGAAIVSLIVRGLRRAGRSMTGGRHEGANGQ